MFRRSGLSRRFYGCAARGSAISRGINRLRIIADADARVKDSSWWTVEVVYVEAVAVVDAAIELVALGRVWVEAFVLAHYRVIWFFRRTIRRLRLGRRR